MISNVQERIDREKIESQVNSTSLEASFLSYYMDWNSYQSEATILGWLKTIMEPFRDFCKTEVIGQTFEGRNMTIMKVSYLIKFLTFNNFNLLVLCEGLQGRLRQEARHVD